MVKSSGVVGVTHHTTEKTASPILKGSFSSQLLLYEFLTQVNPLTLYHDVMLLGWLVCNVMASKQKTEAKQNTPVCTLSWVGICMIKLKYSWILVLLVPTKSWLRKEFKEARNNSTTSIGKLLYVLPSFFLSFFLSGLFYSLYSTLGHRHRDG
jgi:hypothetical protein